MIWDSWIIGWVQIKFFEKTELVIFKSPRKVLSHKIKIKLTGQRPYPSKSVKYLGLRINKFLHWHDQVNNIAVKLNRANGLFLKIRNYIKTKTLRNTYFAIFDSHLTYSCIIWAQNIKQLIDSLFFKRERYESWISNNSYFTQAHFFLKTIFQSLVIKLP